MAKRQIKDKSQIDDEFDFSSITEGSDDIFDRFEPVKYLIDTGNLAMNYVCSGKLVGGGIPGGKVVEVFGDSASGKSLVGMNMLKGVQTLGGIPILLDAECAYNPDFAMVASKMDTSKLLVTSADTLEGCFNKIYNSITRVRGKVPSHIPIAILYDSIAASPSEREFAETKLNMEIASKTEIKEAGAGTDQPGERAKICSKHFRNIPKFLRQNNATLIVINQMRSKIGVMFGDPNTTGGGGRALEYYSSLRLKLTANKVTKDKYEVVNGVNINVKNVKNRCFKPFGEAKGLYLMFTQGINPFGGLLDILIQTERISGGNGNWQVSPEYSNGKEVKFKRSRDLGDVPAEVLLQCPQLVDAESPSQVQYYIDLYSNAITAVEDEVAFESDCKEILE